MNAEPFLTVSWHVQDFLGFRIRVSLLSTDDYWTSEATCSPTDCPPSLLTHSQQIRTGTRNLRHCEYIVINARVRNCIASVHGHS